MTGPIGGMNGGDGLERLSIGMAWNSERPRILVAACSDGRLQEATDEFLARHLGIKDYDRLYIPGGAGALCPSNRDYMRAHQVQQECRYLVDAHGVEQLVLLFHGPAPDGPAQAICADYRRKQPWASIDQVRAQQDKDAYDLLADRWQWAGKAKVSIYRCEVASSGALHFVAMHIDKVAPNVR